MGYLESCQFPNIWDFPRYRIFVDFPFNSAIVRKHSMWNFNLLKFMKTFFLSQKCSVLVNVLCALEQKTFLQRLGVMSVDSSEVNMLIMFGSSVSYWDFVCVVNRWLRGTCEISSAQPVVQCLSRMNVRVDSALVYPGDRPSTSHSIMAGSKTSNESTSALLCPKLEVPLSSGKIYTLFGPSSLAHSRCSMNEINRDDN